MQSSQISKDQNAGSEPLLGGGDSLLGICDAIGKDVGFNPFYLRIALLLVLVVNPVAMIAAYVALGVIVVLSRWLFPDVREAAAQPVSQAEASNEDRPEVNLPIAA